MPYTVSFHESDAIVTVRVSGMASHEEHCAARDEALCLCQKKECSKVLVDLRELNTDRSSTMTCFTFGKSVTQTPPSVRIAHVMPSDAKSREDIRFTSTVEANRGRPTGEFESIEEAEKWLLGKT